MIFGTLFTLLIAIPLYGIIIYIIVLLIKALRKYLKSSEVRKEKAETKKTLGESHEDRDSASSCSCVPIVF